MGGYPATAALDWLAVHGEKRSGWYSGGFGYFPAYTLGAMSAAQLFQAAVAAEVPALQRDAATGVWGWQGAAPEGSYYTYLVDVWVPGTGLARQRVTDPYAISLGTDSRRAWIGRLDDPRLQDRVADNNTKYDLTESESLIVGSGYGGSSGYAHSRGSYVRGWRPGVFKFG